MVVFSSNVSKTRVGAYIHVEHWRKALNLLEATVMTVSELNFRHVCLIARIHTNSKSQVFDVSTCFRQGSSLAAVL